MAKASDKYRNWFNSDQLISDLMDQAADDIDERDAEIERLREALEKIYWATKEPEIDRIAGAALQKKETE